MPGQSLRVLTIAFAARAGKLKGKLRDNLRMQAFDRGLQALQVHKVIELKRNLVSKGNAARLWLEEDNYDLVPAAGDVSAARYSIESAADVRALLCEPALESQKATMAGKVHGV